MSYDRRMTIDNFAGELQTFVTFIHPGLHEDLGIVINFLITMPKLL